MASAPAYPAPPTDKATWTPATVNSNSTPSDYFNTASRLIGGIGSTNGNAARTDVLGSNTLGSAVNSPMPAASRSYSGNTLGGANG